jgi:hypothetical protein
LTRAVPRRYHQQRQDEINVLRPTELAAIPLSGDFALML